MQKRITANPAAERTAGIPHEVVSAVVDGSSPIKAWRRYLKLTQKAEQLKLRASQLKETE